MNGMCNTANTYSIGIHVYFAGTKNISEIDVFGSQQNTVVVDREAENVHNDARGGG